MSQSITILKAARKTSVHVSKSWSLFLRDYTFTAYATTVTVLREPQGELLFL